MDYKGHLCPVCKSTFDKDDDVVVCPVCGTPHHRECYESLGECFNTKRHKENYDYRREFEVNSVADDLVCPACGGTNPPDSKYCNSCGRSFSASGNPTDSDSGARTDGNFTSGRTPGGTPFVVIDALGGVKGDDLLADNVAAKEAAKYVKTGTHYFIPQFRQLYTDNRTRFSFVGFLFCGGWMLYRKMYKLGTVFTVLWGLILLAQTYITLFYSNFLNNALETYRTLVTDSLSKFTSVTEVFSELFGSMTNEQIFIFVLYFVLGFITVLMRVVCGICGNRWYYKHCMKSVAKIKAKSKSPEELEQNLNSRGGVNVPLAISLIASYYILMYLPVFLN